jgi:hypothetical protein
MVPLQKKILITEAWKNSKVDDQEVGTLCEIRYHFSQNNSSIKNTEHFEISHQELPMKISHIFILVIAHKKLNVKKILHIKISKLLFETISSFKTIYTQEQGFKKPGFFRKKNTLGMGFFGYS